MHGVRRVAARRHFNQLALDRDGDRLARLIFQFDVFWIGARIYVNIIECSQLRIYIYMYVYDIGGGLCGGGGGS